MTELAEGNYRSHQAAIWARTDRTFAGVMVAQYVLAVAFSMVHSPWTYTGTVASIHPHVWTALLLGGALTSYPVFLALRRPGAPANRYVVALAQALFSALLIHLTGGRIETHFHVFGSLAFLAMYRDWRVLVAASAVVASDHFLRGAWFPESVYGASSGAFWRFLEHAGWVVFEDAVLIVGLATTVREMRLKAERQAELEIAKTQIEHAAAESRRQSKVLDSVLRGMKDGVVVADAAGRFLCFNPAAGEILGADAPARGLDAWPRAFGLLGEDGEAVPAEAWPFFRAMRGESVDHEEYLFRRAEGGESWLEISAQPLPDDRGGCAGGVAVFRDVSERRRMLDESARARDEAERANRAKSEFLSRMSHELRTPMNAILGFGQLLKLDELSEEQEESVDQILRGGAHLLRLINEVLDISGIEAGKLTLSKEPVDAGALVAEAFAMLQPLADASGIALVLEPPAPGEGFVLADHQRLLQVAINLVSNAIKYNFPGGEVRLSVEPADGRRRLLVEDTGIGIPEEKWDALFNPFERLGAQDTEVEGTGLGLALSRRLAEAMDGHVGLLPRPVGTCFYVDLPAAGCPLLALETGNWVEEEAPLPAGGEMSVLLVEDNPANIDLMRRIFRARPEIRLRVARRGDTALTMARESRPDAVLLDMDLPDMNGLEALKRLRNDPPTARVPVLVVSADANPSHIRRAMEAGATDYLTKPYDVRALLARLAALAPAREEARRVA